MASFSNRRTIRKYKQEDIPQEKLDALLFQASRAATMGNMQLYSVIVTRSEEMKEKLSPLHFGQPMVKGAPVVLTFCADFNRFTRWCEQRNADAGYDNYLFCVENVSGPPHAFICGKPIRVCQDVLLTYPVADGIVIHDLDFIM